jgi:hypothetical protein
VITRLGRRCAELTVLLFAGLGFAHVPLGDRTGLEHLRAILDTQPAQKAARELLTAARKLGDRWLEFGTGASPRNATEPRSRTPRSLAKIGTRSGSSRLAREPADAGADASLTWPSS